MAKAKNTTEEVTTTESTTQKKPRMTKLERAEEELRKAKERSKKALDAEKQAQREVNKAQRNERTHHLCVRGGAVNTMLRDPDAFTDEEVVELIEFAFSLPEVQNRLVELLPPDMNSKSGENREEYEENG